SASGYASVVRVHARRACRPRVSRSRLRRNAKPSQPPQHSSIMIRRLWMFSFSLAMAATATAQAPKQSGSKKSADPTYVQVGPKPAERRVDILVGGKAFTSYIWPTTLKKPVLYPLRSASGTVVTRGFPLEPRPGERVDHPHQAGLWFEYGDVNGLDFWNNS